MGQQVQGVALSETGGALPVPTGGEPWVTEAERGEYLHPHIKNRSRFRIQAVNIERDIHPV